MGRPVDKPPPTSKPAPEADGWRELFNGRDLTGWTFKPVITLFRPIGG